MPVNNSAWPAGSTSAVLCSRGNSQQVMCAVAWPCPLEMHHTGPNQGDMPCGPGACEWRTPCHSSAEAFSMLRGHRLHGRSCCCTSHVGRGLAHSPSGCEAGQASKHCQRSCRLASWDGLRRAGHWSLWGPRSMSSRSGDSETGCQKGRRTFRGQVASQIAIQGWFRVSMGAADSWLTRGLS